MDVKARKIDFGCSVCCPLPLCVFLSWSAATAAAVAGQSQLAFLYFFMLACILIWFLVPLCYREGYKGG